MGRELTTDETAEIQAMGERLQEIAADVDAKVISVHGPAHRGKKNRVYANVHTRWHPDNVEDTHEDGGGYSVWATWTAGNVCYIHGEYQENGESL